MMLQNMANQQQWFFKVDQSTIFIKIMDLYATQKIPWFYE